MWIEDRPAFTEELLRPGKGLGITGSGGIWPDFGALSAVCAGHEILKYVVMWHPFLKFKALEKMVANPIDGRVLAKHLGDQFECERRL